MTSPRRHKGAGCDRLRLTTERLRVSDSDSATRPTPTYLQGAYAHFLGDCNPLIITVVLERSLVSQPLGQTLLSRRSRLLLLAHIDTSYLQSRSRFAYVSSSTSLLSLAPTLLTGILPWFPTFNRSPSAAGPRVITRHYLAPMQNLSCLDISTILCFTIIAVPPSPVLTQHPLKNFDPAICSSES